MTVAGSRAKATEAALGAPADGSPLVVVIGGGISGLAAARQLARGGARVSVLEASPRLGGKIAGVTVGPLQLDGGAESMLARRPEAVALLTELGLSDRLVHPTGAKPSILVDGVACPIPPSLMGVPTDPSLLAGLLSEAGVERAGQEVDLDAPALAGDVALGEIVAQRFGDEVTDRLLEPLLGGVYAGHARQLSFAAVHPGLYAAARAGGALSEHARGLLRPSAGPVFAGLKGGVHTLITALSDDLVARGVALRTGVTVRELIMNGDGWSLVCGPVPAPEIIRAAAVVLATPAAATGRLLAGAGVFSDDLGERLHVLPYASMAVVSLIVRGVEGAGSGLLVPPGELPTIKAITYSSNKWDWVASEVQNSYGEGVCAVRASVGRLGETELLQVDDDTLIARTFTEARENVPGWDRAELVDAAVTRWGGGLPQYLVGHGDLVTEIRASLDGSSSLAVCGALYDGVGIAACLGSADQAATKIINGWQAGDLRTVVDHGSTMIMNEERS